MSLNLTIQFAVNAFTSWQNGYEYELKMENTLIIAEIMKKSQKMLKTSQI